MIEEKTVEFFQRFKGTIDFNDFTLKIQIKEKGINRNEIQHNTETIMNNIIESVNKIPNCEITTSY